MKLAKLILLLVFLSFLSGNWSATANESRELWNPDHANYNDIAFHIDALPAGLIDGALEEIKSLPLLMSLVVDYSTSAATRQKVKSILSDFDFTEALEEWYEERKDLYTNQPVHIIEHQTGKDVVGVATILTGTGAALKALKNGAAFVDGLVGQVKKKIGNGKRLVGDLSNAGGALTKLGTLIDDKIKVLPTEKLFGTQASTFLNSKYVIAETTESILTYRRFGGEAKLGGGYVSTLDKLSREELALVKGFNNSMRFEAVIKIPKGQKLAVGKVGPWPVKAPEFMGGADQIIIKGYDFPKVYPENVWVQSVKDFKTGTIYSYGDFCRKFSNLCAK